MNNKESLKTKLFRIALNFYPMFFGTGGKALFISGDWTRAVVQLRLSLLTRNYVGTIFGGSQFAAADPFFMVLLINCLKGEYIVWDKAGKIDFKKPGRGKIRAEFIYTPEEIENIKQITNRDGRYEFPKTIQWIDEEGDVVSVVEKLIYVSTKEYAKKRKLEREANA
jgi:hypothetical protein